MDGEQMLCLDCNEIVEPRTYKEYQGEYPHGGYVYYDECPQCGGDRLEDYDHCNGCGKPIESQYVYCEECAKENEI